MPIRDHPEAFSTIPCETVRYGVLVGVSTGYPPVAGRLHTRYAPVRRSPAVYCYTPLPLDLHVLGLPLAFILSQDQTLHCKNCLLLPLTRLRVSAPGPPRMPPTHAISCSKIIQSSLCFLVSCFINSACFLESECKDTTFFQTTKKNLRKNFHFWYKTMFFNHKKKSIFFCRNPNMGCKNRFPTQK